LLQGVAEEIPLDDNSVQLIISNNGLNNVADSDKALTECARVLQSGCQLVMSMNLESSMKEFYDALLKSVSNLEISELSREVQERMKKQIHDKRKPLDIVTTELESHGLQVQNIIHDSFIYRFADGSSLLAHYFFRLAFWDGWKSIIPEEHHDIVFKELEVILNKEAKINGQVCLSIPFVVIDCIKVQS
jgi:SAM-dependent methyltransferase